MLGALLKMKMVGFRDPAFRKPTFTAFTAQVNPESYSMDHSVDHGEQQAAGTSAQNAPYVATKARMLSFEIVFDATGAIGDTLIKPDVAVGIAPQVALFKQTVYTFFGDSHRPPYVLLTWGTLVFPCQIETLSLNYKLFSPEGVPLRATAKVSFQEVIEDTMIARLANALSADLTHVRTVQAGDTLPLLCHQVYGDATLYGKVARVNQLANFRSLRVGQQLAFPPLVPAEDAA